MTISDLIRLQRDRLDLTLEDVGRACGVSRATVSRWESGEIKKMKRNHIEALAKTLNLNPVLFLSDPELVTPAERMLLDKYRKASPNMRQAALVLLSMKGEEEELVEELAPFLWSEE